MQHIKSKIVLLSLSMCCLVAVQGCSNNANDALEQSNNSVQESKSVYDSRIPQEILTAIQNNVVSNDLESALKDYKVLLSVDKDSVMRTAQARDWLKEKYLISGDIDTILSLYDGINNELILSEKEKMVKVQQSMKQATQLESEEKYGLASELYKELYTTNKLPTTSYFYGKYVSDTLEEMKEFIRSKKYNEAYTISDDTEKLPEGATLRYYAFAKQVYSEGDTKWAVNLLEDSARGYTGEFAKEIDDFKLSLKPRDYWYDVDVSHYQIQDRLNKVDPSIGMSESEVRNSKWGEPQEVNKTTTEYGTSEQWVYNGDRYVYVDNGVVSGIQE